MAQSGHNPDSSSFDVIVHRLLRFAQSRDGKQVVRGVYRPDLSVAHYIFSASFPTHPTPLESSAEARPCSLPASQGVPFLCPELFLPRAPRWKVLLIQNFALADAFMY